jgi:hypothetical protein
MKKLVGSLCIWAVLAVPAFAVPDIEFNPDALGWFYDGGGTFDFSRSVAIRRVLGGTADTLVGQFVNLPALAVSGLPGGPYTASALAAIEIVDGGGGVLLTGTLGAGNLIPVGATAAAYPYIKADITGVTINNTIGSALLAYWQANPDGGIDMNLSLENNIDMGGMLAGGISDGDGFSGSMTLVPEPATVVLLGLGGALLAVTNRKKRG